VSWIKKAFAVGVVLGGSTAFGCSGTNQLVGSDGLTVSATGGKDGGSGATGGAPPTFEPTHELLQLNLAAPDDGRPYLCLPDALPTDDTGNAACYVVSARETSDCNCAAAGLSPTTAAIVRAARAQSKLAALCDAADRGACADLCVCAVDPAVGTSLQQCQSEAEPDASTTGWCYVSAEGGPEQQALVESCPRTQAQRLRFFGPATGALQGPGADANPSETLFLGCPTYVPVSRLGERCISEDEHSRSFAGYSVSEVNIDERASMCESNLCIQNHFQGRASCPQGQAEGGGDCLAAGSYDPVTVPVPAQLPSRPAALTSICSCQCAGPGPGPFCTCPESMQCAHLVDDLEIGDNHLAGSYCIPNGTQYNP